MLFFFFFHGAKCLGLAFEIEARWLDVGFLCVPVLFWGARCFEGAVNRTGLKQDDWVEWLYAEVIELFEARCLGWVVLCCSAV